MKIVVGLGNPGEKYKHTRHNAGFLAVDYTIADLGLKIEDFRFNNKFNSLVLETNSDHSDAIRGLGSLLFIKPETFMNGSGSAIKQIRDFYKIDVSKELLVVHDDSDLPLGTVRATDSSSSAGHKGVQDIIDRLGTQDFHRIRIGMDTRASRLDIDTEIYVLQPFSDDDLKKLSTDVFPKAKLEIEKFIENCLPAIGSGRRQAQAGKLPARRSLGVGGEIGNSKTAH